jgi:hypothetical protein
MSETVCLEIPDDLAGSARALAAATNRSFEETLLEWIRSAVNEPPIETLSNESVLALCDQQFGEAQQSEFSELLAVQRDGLLNSEDQLRLDALLREYRRGLVQKARALKEAVDRGLLSALNQHGA